jgi:BirA family biotin operon repressor/biotin-[acetyl-CoA-carboxylase] ligase
MTESEILPHLATRLFGRHLVLLESTDSTNTFTRKLAQEGAPEGTVVLAEVQSAGRGRLGRQWDSERGTSLTFTILLRPRIAAGSLGLLPLAAGVAVCETVREETGLAAACKWPNDVLVGNQKLCGILSEAVLQGEEVTAAAVGIGLNVNQESFAPLLEGRATSLRLLTGREQDRGRFLAAILGRLEPLYDLLQRAETQAVVDRWTVCTSMIGRAVQVTGGGATRGGTVRGIGHDGALLLETAAGPVTLHAGDVTLREP